MIYMDEVALARIKCADMLSDLGERAEMRAWAEYRIDMLAAAIEVVERVGLGWLQAKLRKEVDRKLTLIWDEEREQFRIDRYVASLGYNLNVTFVPKDYEFGDGSDLVNKLKEGDIQRYSSPQAYVEMKRKNSAAVRAMLEAKGDDAVYGAVDSLSNRSIHELLEAEKAMRRGEKVMPQGADAESFNRMHEAAKKSPPPPPDSENVFPGLHPDVYVPRQDYSQGDS